MRKVIINDKDYGDGLRLSYQENELDKAPMVPNPIEYEDIDKTVIKFFEDNVSIVGEDGKKFPLFAFFSLERFSEFSQTWGHSDEDGNLLTNFKTVVRQPNPQVGTIHGSLFNIPGRDRFTVSMREIVDDTGVECYEVTSMSQPLPVNFEYTLTCVTSKNELLNEFNAKVNRLFDCKQCYICVNGHYMPMVLDEIGDETTRGVDERKVFIQPISITLMAYVIPKDDIIVQKVPKRVSATVGRSKLKKDLISMEYDDEDDSRFSLKIILTEGMNKVKFTSEDHMKLVFSDKVNVKNFNVRVDDTDAKTDMFVVNEGEEVTISVNKLVGRSACTLYFDGEIL